MLRMNSRRPPAVRHKTAPSELYGSAPRGNVPLALGAGILQFGAAMKLELIPLVWCAALGAVAQTPQNLVLDGVPSISPELRANAAPYLEFRVAAFLDWRPSHSGILISTRFANTVQLHEVRIPGGARRQLTFSSEPIRDGGYRPGDGKFVVFAQDTGGGEFYQLYRYDFADGAITLLTDGRSRNMGMRWSRSGQWLAYTSTRRNGRDNDIYVVDPSEPKTTRLLIEVNGGGWGVQDWSYDDAKLIVSEYISINESKLHLADVKSGARQLLASGAEGEKVAHPQARFGVDGQTIYLTTDRDSEFRRLAALDLESREIDFLTPHIPWDVSEFEVSRDGRWIAYVTNEDGISRMRLMEADAKRPGALPAIPTGVISGLKWREDGKGLAFTLTSAKSPSDAYALNRTSDGWELERWTESETGGLNPASFVEPERIEMRSFDGLRISAFVYRPDPDKFPGRRPALVSIHGGPESQFRPGFQARNNYYVNELGIVLVCPNVRGSAGYGKTFLTLDNGFKREDSVRDIGTVLDWARADSGIDGGRVGVMGGSYGGYMVLASMARFNDRLRCGVDVVGISNFLTFLQNTQEYRRDLRRAEYGDERDLEMRRFFEKISPVNQVDKIKKPLLIVQGKNDPRVPFAESEQMVQAIRTKGGTVWYAMAKDEGHGFAKKENADVQFLATILFLQEHLLAPVQQP